MRYNVNLSEELIEKVDKKAASMYMSRSAFISMCLSERLQRDEMLECMPEMLAVIKEYGLTARPQDSEKQQEVLSISTMAFFALAPVAF